MKYKISTLAKKLRAIVKDEENTFGGPTEQSEVIRQAASVLENIRQPQTVYYVYTENNDAAAYRAQEILLFKKHKDGIKYLRKQVEKHYGMSWEKIRGSLVGECDSLEEDYVSIDTGNGIDFFTLDEITVR